MLLRKKASTHPSGNDKNSLVLDIEGISVKAEIFSSVPVSTNVTWLKLKGKSYSRNQAGSTLLVESMGKKTSIQEVVDQLPEAAR